MGSDYCTRQIISFPWAYSARAVVTTFLSGSFVFVGLHRPRRQSETEKVVGGGISVCVPLWPTQDSFEHLLVRVSLVHGVRKPRRQRLPGFLVQLHPVPALFVGFGRPQQKNVCAAEKLGGFTECQPRNSLWSKLQLQRTRAIILRGMD